MEGKVSLYSSHTSLKFHALSQLLLHFRSTLTLTTMLKYHIGLPNLNF